MKEFRYQFPDDGVASYHLYDEDNNMTLALNNKAAGYYCYSASQQRVYKLTGMNMYQQRNAGEMTSDVIFDNYVLYPNPYVVVTPKGYSKHYYAGSERIASSIGGMDCQEEVL